MKAQAHWLLFVFFLTVVPGLVAQDSRVTHSVSGSVQSTHGQPLAGIQIEARQWLTGRTVARTYSEANGSFMLSGIPPGRYEIVVTSGLVQASEPVELAWSDGLVSLSIPSPEEPHNSLGGQATVSVRQLHVPKDAQKAYHKAWEALRAGKTDEARQQVDKALTICPSDALALTLRAGIQLDQNQPQEAAADAEKAVESDPNYGMAYLVLGTVYNRLLRFSDAVRILEKGMSLQPNAWQAYFEMSKALLGRGDYAGVVRNTDRAWTLSPTKYAPILLVRAQARLAMKDYEPAARDLENYLQSDSKSAVSSQVRETLDQVRALLETSARK